MLLQKEFYKIPQTLWKPLVVHVSDYNENNNDNSNNNNNRLFKAQGYLAEHCCVTAMYICKRCSEKRESDYAI